MDVGTRSAQWLGEVVDLMREPTCTVPVPALLTLMRQAFGVASCSWNWFDADGSFGMADTPVGDDVNTVYQGEVILNAAPHEGSVPVPRSSLPITSAETTAGTAVAFC